MSTENTSEASKQLQTTNWALKVAQRLVGQTVQLIEQVKKDDVPSFRAWVDASCGDTELYGKVYIRLNKHAAPYVSDDTIDPAEILQIASVETTPRSGIFAHYLRLLSGYLYNLGIRGIYVENVMNPVLAYMLAKQGFQRTRGIQCMYRRVVRPCPYCGGAADVVTVVEHVNAQSYTIACPNTECVFPPMVPWIDLPDLLQHWNTRHTDLDLNHIARLALCLERGEESYPFTTEDSKLIEYKQHGTGTT